MSGLIVVGGGQAGGRAIEALRANGYAGAITLISAEPHLPYERPPLSKEMLLDPATDRIDWVRPAQWYDENHVVQHLGVAARRIDRVERVVELEDDSRIAYDRLLLATGASARRLAVPGADHPRCFCIRTLEDSEALRRLMVPGAEIVVIGAGFIGLEAAAAARSRGCNITVLEAGSRVMARGVPERISEIYASLHRRHGVDLRLGVQVEAIGGTPLRPVVSLADGTNLAAEAVVVGIGVSPNVALARDCGLEIEDGIVVDARGATSDPAIFAAGDVTRHFNPLLGRSLRLESWQNAQNQAISTARNMAGVDSIYAEVPWFWSDQFGVNLQITGLPSPGAEQVVRGDLDGCSGLLFELVDGRLVCAIGLNAARDLRLAKQIIGLGMPVDAAKLTDPTIKLADLYRSMKTA